MSDRRGAPGVHEMPNSAARAKFGSGGINLMFRLPNSSISNEFGMVCPPRPAPPRRAPSRPAPPRPSAGAADAEAPKPTDAFRGD